MIDQTHCRMHSTRMREARDCSVQACAVAAQIDYPTMHSYLKHYGRTDKRGMRMQSYHRALKDLGFKLTALRGPKIEFGWTYVRREYPRLVRKKVGKGEDYSARTVLTLSRELTEGTYLVNTAGHVLCLRDGVVHDWSAKKCLRIEAVYRVEEA